ncbi:hypothetical protein ACROYT_G001175 [Oculina patagonica]
MGSLDEGRNLYNILRLDMEKVRAMSKGKQDEEIRTAFIRELRIWHLEFNDDGDEAIVRGVIMAYDILQDREKRASKEATANGCDVHKWLMKIRIGYVLAVMPGGAAIGVTLLESASLKVGEFIACRAAIGALSGASASLVSDSKKKIVDGEDITCNQAMGHAAAAAAAGLAATMAGLHVAKVMASNQTATASADHSNDVIDSTVF